MSNTNTNDESSTRTIMQFNMARLVTEENKTELEAPNGTTTVVGGVYETVEVKANGDVRYVDECTNCGGVYWENTVDISQVESISVGNGADRVNIDIDMIQDQIDIDDSRADDRPETVAIGDQLHVKSSIPPGYEYDGEVIVEEGDDQ